jgi:anti-anti-sigma factor
MSYRPETAHVDPIAIDTGDVGGGHVVTVTGEVDIYSGSRLRVALSEVIDASPGRPVVVDLTSVTLLSSTGCAVLVDAHRQAQQHRCPFALVVDHGSRAVPLTLHAAGLMTHFTTYGDLEEARRSAAS